MSVNGNSQAYRFPSSRCALWDHGTKGPSFSLHLTYQREIEITISQQVLSLASKLSNQSKNSCLDCILIGHCLRDNKHRFIISVERIEADIDQFRGNGLRCHGEIHIPFKIFKGNPESKISPESCFTSMKTLRNNLTSPSELDLTNFLSLRAYAGYSSSQQQMQQKQSTSSCGFTWLEVDALLPGTCCTASPVLQLPIVPTALAKSLASRISEMSEYQAEFRYGFLSMDQTRKLVLFLDSDTKALAAPLIGIWVSGVNYVTDPLVWTACLRFLFSSAFTDRVCLPPQPFLLLVYSPLHARPEFYDVKCPTATLAAAAKHGHRREGQDTVPPAATPRMDFCLCSGRGNLQAFSKSGGKGAEAFKMELARVEQGTKRVLLDNVNRQFTQTILKEQFNDASLRSDIFDEMVPRDPLSLSSSHRGFAVNSGPEVPEVSLIANDSSVVQNHGPPNGKYHVSGNPYQLIAEKVRKSTSSDSNHHDKSDRRSSESIPRKPLPKRQTISKKAANNGGPSPPPAHPASFQYPQVHHPSYPPPPHGYVMGGYPNYMYPAGASVDGVYYPTPPPQVVNWVYPAGQHPQQQTWLPSQPPVQHDSRPSSARSQEVNRLPIAPRPATATVPPAHRQETSGSRQTFPSNIRPSTGLSDAGPGKKSAAPRVKRPSSSSSSASSQPPPPLDTSDVTAALMKEAATSLPAFNFSNEQDLKMLETLIESIIKKQQTGKVTCSIATNTSDVWPSGDCLRVQHDQVEQMHLVNAPDNLPRQSPSCSASPDNVPCINNYQQDQHLQHEVSNSDASLELARRCPLESDSMSGSLIRPTPFNSDHSQTSRLHVDQPSTCTVSVTSSRFEDQRASPVGQGVVQDDTLEENRSQDLDVAMLGGNVRSNQHEEKLSCSESSEESCGAGYSKLLDNIKEFLGQNQPETAEVYEDGGNYAGNETEFSSVAQLRCFLTENAETINTIEYSRSGGNTSTFYQPNVTLLQQRINYVSMLLDDTTDNSDVESLELTSLARKYLSSVQMQLLAAEGGSTKPSHRQSLQVRKLCAAAVPSGAPSPGVTQYGINMTDMSLATRRYMEKYNLIPQQEVSSCNLENMRGLPSSTPANTEFMPSSQNTPRQLANQSPSPPPPVLKGAAAAPSIVSSVSNLRVLDGYCRQPPLPVLPGVGRCQVTTSERMFGSEFGVDEENTVSDLRQQDQCSKGNRVLDLERLKQLPKLL